MGLLLFMLRDGILKSLNYWGIVNLRNIGKFENFIKINLANFNQIYLKRISNRTLDDLLEKIDLSENQFGEIPVMIR